MTAEALGC
jgi:hypothetical protein